MVSAAATAVVSEAVLEAASVAAMEVVSAEASVVALAVSAADVAVNQNSQPQFNTIENHFFNFDF